MRRKTHIIKQIEKAQASLNHNPSTVDALKKQARAKAEKLNHKLGYFVEQTNFSSHSYWLTYCLTCYKPAAISDVKWKDTQMGGSALTDLCI